MADKCLPADWNDDDRMNFMFSAFSESRDVNPKHWDSKLHFWSKAILESCKYHGDIHIDLTTLKRRFSRNGLTPLGLSIVLREMLQQGKLERKQDFFNCSTEGWMSWFYGVAKSTFWWSARTVLGGADDVKVDEQFVLVDVAKENAAWVLDKHYSCVECDTTDHIIPWNVLKTRCPKFDEETLEIVMAYLQRHSKAVLFIAPEGEKVVKFARKGEQKVTAVSDNDIDIVKLRKTVASLTLQVNKLSNEVERCRFQAASCAKEGSKSKALKLLRKKELRQRTLDKAISNLNSFEEILHRIQNAHTDKMVIEALKSGTAALKGAHSEITIDAVEDVMDELNETLNASQDIDSALTEGNVRVAETAGIGSTELEELERELESLAIGDKETAPAILPGTNVQQITGGLPPLVDHQSRSPLSRPALRPEASVNSTHNQWVDREPVHLPEVPSHSLIKTGTSAPREKPRPLVSS